MEWFHKVVGDRLPEHDFLMTYGSGAFPQANYEGVPVIDYVLSVPDITRFHKENLEKNSADYSAISKSLGPKNLSSLGKNLVFYNAFVNVEGREIKYGVVETKTLIKDLMRWNNHFLAGRCKNPIKKIKSNQKIDEALQVNLEYGVNLALLASPEKIWINDFYKIIAGFSYNGSIRQVFGFEDKNKLVNIISKNKEYYDKTYEEFIKNDPNLVLSNGILHQNKAPDVNNLRFTKTPGLGRNLEESLSELQRRVFWSSVKQISLGLISAGPVKSYVYLSNKKNKAKKSKNKIAAY